MDCRTFMTTASRKWRIESKINGHIKISVIQQYSSSLGWPSYLSGNTWNRKLYHKKMRKKMLYKLLLPLSLGPIWVIVAASKILRGQSPPHTQRSKLLPPHLGSMVFSHCGEGGFGKAPQMPGNTVIQKEKTIHKYPNLTNILASLSRKIGTVEKAVV